MRPAGRGDLDSLYFDYPTFTAPNRKHVLAHSECKVAIVGAGPIGMFAALHLARFGIASTVFDNKNTFNDGSRAICVQRNSFQSIERIGAIKSFLDKALGWTTGRTFFRGQQILEFQMPHADNEKYLPMYNIQQQFIEQYLWDAVEASNLIDTRWCSEVVGCNDTDEGVRLLVYDTNGSYVCNAQWVLAADGARSAVRTQRGLRLKGDNFAGRYVIADVQMDHDYPTIRRALFDSDSNPDKTILIHRQPDNIWRIDYQLPDGQSENDAISEDSIRENVIKILKDIGFEGEWDLEWWSIYSANTLALDNYRDGRVIFIGDSAHIVPIFGVRGLNNGLADAENVAWKLARVLNGLSDDTLMDSYSTERRGATLDVFDNATKSARFMTPQTKGYTLMRDAALSLSLDHGWAGDFANPRQMEPYVYANDYVSNESASSMEASLTTVKLGAILPNEQLDDNAYLSDLLGNGFTLLMLDDSDSPVHENLKAALQQIDPLVALLTSTHIQEKFSVTALSRVHARLGTESGVALLIRPDGYLAGIWKSSNTDNILAWMSAAFGNNRVQ